MNFIFLITRLRASKLHRGLMQTKQEVIGFWSYLQFVSMGSYCPYKNIVTYNAIRYNET